VFEDERALKLRWRQLEPLVQIRLCNIGDAEAVEVTAALVGFDFKVNDVVRPVADVLTLMSPPPASPSTPSEFSIASGECVTLKLTQGPDVPDAGDYGGVIVVRRPGAIARRELTVTGPVANATKPAAAVDEVNLRARRSDPLDDTISLESPRSIPLAVTTGERFTVPAKGMTIGVLQNGYHRATVIVTGTPYKNARGILVLPIRIDAPGFVGTYSGTVDIAAGSEDSVLVKLKIEASDPWGWALVAILVGIAIAVIATLLLQHTIPIQGLHHRSRNLLDKYRDAKRNFDSHYGDAIFRRLAEPDQLREAYGIDEANIKAYATRVNQSIERYAKDNILVDRTSDDYKKLVRDLQTAEADAELFGAEDGFGTKLTELKKAIDDFEAAHPGYAPLFLIDAKSRLNGQQLPVGGATKIGAEADEYIKLARKWTDLAITAGRLEAWIVLLKNKELSYQDEITLGDAKARVDVARLKMRDATDEGTLMQSGAERDLRQVYAQLLVLGATYRVPQPTNQEAEALRAIGGLMFTAIAPLGLYAVEGRRLAWAVPEVRGVVPVAELVVDVLGQTARGFAAFYVLIFGIVSAVVVALPTVLTDDTFGTWRDYLAALGLSAAAAAAAKAIFDTLTHLRRDRVASEEIHAGKVPETTG
jgi:hypothetical protein